MVLSGEEIKRRRMANGWTQVELAKKVGASRRAVVNWEAGEDPQGRNMNALERVLRDDSSETEADGLLLQDADFAQVVARLHELYQEARRR